VVFKEFKIFKEEDVAIGPQGRGYVQAWQFRVFYSTKVAYKVFPPLTAGVSSCKLQVFPL